MTSSTLDLDRALPPAGSLRLRPQHRGQTVDRMHDRDRAWAQRTLSKGVLGAAAGVGVATSVTGWTLPVPWDLRTLAGLLAAATVVAVATGCRVVLSRAATTSSNARWSHAALVVALAVTGISGPPADAAETTGRQALSAAEVHSVLTTAVLTSAVSGAHGSLVDRTSLGPRGRAFVDGERVVGAARAYVGIAAQEDERARVLLALREWVRLGGLQRSTVLVAVPTGSGWVNAPGVRAAETAAGGDLSTVVVQYADRASWLELALDRGRATRVAQMLVLALDDVLTAIPADRRPRIVLFGESLGGEAVAAATGPGVAACLATGRPRAGIPSSTPPTCTDVVNPDDPVTAWTPSLLWRPKGEPGWWPIASFWRVSIELLTALDQPVGHGHRYEGSILDEWSAIWPTPGNDLEHPSRATGVNRPGLVAVHR